MGLRPCSSAIGRTCAVCTDDNITIIVMTNTNFILLINFFFALYKQKISAHLPTIIHTYDLLNNLSFLLTPISLMCTEILKSLVHLYIHTSKCIIDWIFSYLFIKCFFSHIKIHNSVRSGFGTKTDKLHKDSNIAHC